MRPEVSVVVPSHERPLRLRWLLNALEEQTMDPDRFEVVVVHDCVGDETEDLLLDHPLAKAGRLRHRRLAAGSGKPGRQRNLGWRLARAPLIAFTDDDCRPEPGWLETLLSASTSHPGAIVQGRTRPDPYESELLLAPHARSIVVDPPGPFAQTCNILYPKAVLERNDGFAEEVQLTSGEDTDLALRSRESGAVMVGEPGAVVNHSVEAFSLLGVLRLTRKWSDLAYVVKRHPSMRRRLVLGIFWRPSHAALMAMAIGLALPSWRLRALSPIPYLWIQVGGARTPRQALRSLLRTPGRLVIDGFEVFVCIRGSVRHRTLFL